MGRDAMGRDSVQAEVSRESAQRQDDPAAAEMLLLPTPAFPSLSWYQSRFILIDSFLGLLDRAR